MYGARGRRFQIEFHLSNRFADPAADGLLSAFVAQPYFRARFTGNETRNQHLAQVRRQSFERTVKIQLEQGLLLLPELVQIRQHVQEHPIISVLKRKRLVQRCEPFV